MTTQLKQSFKFQARENIHFATRRISAHGQDTRDGNGTPGKITAREKKMFPSSSLALRQKVISRLIRIAALREISIRPRARRFCNKTSGKGISSRRHESHKGHGGKREHVHDLSPCACAVSEMMIIGFCTSFVHGWMMSDKEISGRPPVAGASPDIGEDGAGAGAEAGAARLAVCADALCPLPDEMDLSFSAGEAL